MDGWTDTGLRCPNAIPTSRDPVPLSHVMSSSFDTVYDLLWTGDSKGRLASYRQGLGRYSSFYAHNSEVRSILTNDKGVMSLSSTALSIHNRRGVSKALIQDAQLTGMHAMCFSTIGTNDILVGGESSSYANINLEKQCVSSSRSRTSSNESGTIPAALKLRRDTRVIVSGMSDGTVEIIDPQTLETVNKYQAHMGRIADMDSKQHLIITCGYSQRNAGYMPDPLVNLYDLRAMKTLPPLAFPAGAAFVRLHPKLSTSCVIASLSGQLQLMDITNPANTYLHQAAITSFLTNMDVSSSGDYLSLIDEEGFIQLWGGPALTANAGSVNFTDFATKLEFPTSQQTNQNWFDVNDYSRPLSSVGMPFYKEELLSSWSDPKTQVFETGKFPQYINPDILSVVQAVPNSNIGYAPYDAERYGPRNLANPYFSINNVRRSSIAAPRFISEKARSGMADEESLLVDDSDEGQDQNKKSTQSQNIPKKYRQLEIKYSKFGVEDFDFSFYNKTQYSGLETQVSSSSVNALIQIYKYSSYLYNYVIDACCQERASTSGSPNLLIQLGYLFDMLEKARGKHCQARNFVDILDRIPEAKSLGIARNDLSDSITALDNENIQIMSQLSLSPQRQGRQGSVLTSSRLRTLDPQAHMLQLFVLFLMRKLSADSKMLDLRLEGGSMEELFGVNVQTATKILSCGTEKRKENITYAIEIASRIGNRSSDFCTLLQNGFDTYFQTRTWCDNCQKHQLTGTFRAVKSLPKVLNILINRDLRSVNGFPNQHSPSMSNDGRPQFELMNAFGILSVKGKLSVEPLESTKTYDKQYELLGFVCEVSHQIRMESHLVSIVKISGCWYLFNDFLVQEISESEAFDMTPEWKSLVMLVYQEVVSPDFHNVRPDRLNDELLYIHNFIPADAAKFMNYKTQYELLTKEEAPRPGSMVAIDAEFVMLRDEDTEIRSDGTKLLLKPKAQSLARVSVLRYSTEEPFIDDYIASTSPVLDHLTEFSGIEPGDLDQLISNKRLVTLETAYRRLWLLLNLGCIFIGHGLVNDFRTINMQVPDEQIRDTLDIYYLPSRQRKLSLKFLAWYLLDEKVQTGNHDSIEDARTALLLYKKYLQLNQSGTFEQALEDVYNKGAKLSFRPPLE